MAFGSKDGIDEDQPGTLLRNCHRLSRDGRIRTIGLSVLVSQLALPLQRSTSFFHSRVACVRAMDFLARDTPALRRLRRDIRRSTTLATKGILPNNQRPTFARLSSHSKPTLRGYPVDLLPTLPSLAQGPLPLAARRNPRKGCRALRTLRQDIRRFTTLATKGILPNNQRPTYKETVIG